MSAEAHVTSGDEFALKSHLSTCLFALQASLAEAQHAWLVEAMAAVRTDTADTEALAQRLMCFMARAKRCLGEQRVSVTLPVYASESGFTAGEWTLSHWSKADLGRWVLLATALLASPHDKYLTLAAVFRFADNSEKRAVLIGLYWLLEDPRLVAFTAEVQRTNDLNVFCALATANPFPTRHLPETQFNQLVLKALFLGVSIDHIVDIQARNNAELQRMAEDYLHERRLADREIPPSLWLLLKASNVSQPTQAAWLLALNSDSDDQRYYSARALVSGWEAGEPLPIALEKALRQRPDTETHPTIRALVQDMH
ncbi:MAG TPA: hypothetical protein DD979_12485 [Gammaproteobacteria bacterium]|jgi:hypothetical protein|nr:hypothetical protein [Gammaproteobacteria bacterium]